MADNGEENVKRGAHARTDAHDAVAAWRASQGRTDAPAANAADAAQAQAAARAQQQAQERERVRAEQQAYQAHLARQAAQQAAAQGGQQAPQGAPTMAFDQVTRPVSAAARRAAGQGGYAHGTAAGAQAGVPVYNQAAPTMAFSQQGSPAGAQGYGQGAYGAQTYAQGAGYKAGQGAYNQAAYAQGAYASGQPGAAGYGQAAGPTIAGDTVAFDGSPYFQQPPQKGNYVIPRKKKRHPVRNFFIVLLILILALGAGGFLYLNRLDNALSLDSNSRSQVLGQLTESISGKPFYVLLLGTDSRDIANDDDSRSDNMLLERVDSANKTLTMLTVPRDTPYTLPDGTVTKINEAYYLGGPAASVQAVSQLTGLPISHYAEVDYAEFATAVDAIGGITVNVPQEMEVKDAYTKEMVVLQPGLQTLNGQQATAFVRGRMMFEGDQDATRQGNVRAATTAILKKVLERPFYEIPAAVLDVAECVDTDMGAVSLIPLALGFGGSTSDMKVYSASGPSLGGYNEQYGLWMCYENPQGWAAVVQAMEAGQDPSTIDVNATAIIP